MWQKIEDKQKWDQIISSRAHDCFLQSWEWGEFQKSLGRKVLRFSWNDEIFVQAIKMNLPFGFAYWYVPRGPIVLSESSDASGAMSELADELGRHGALFLRIDPMFRLKLDARRVSSTQPECTSILDLSKDEEILLSEMRPKTRYNIRLAQKKGVKISEGAIDEFLRLNSETRGRDKFTPHPDEHYRKMIQALPGEFVKIWKAEFQGKVIASNIVLYFADTTTYAHGASSNENKEAMAPHLLQWKIIQDARNRGYRYYDFYGVNPDKENHPAYKKTWQGISRFKAGFSGDLVCYPQSFDLIHRKMWYRLYRLSKAIIGIF